MVASEGLQNGDLGMAEVRMDSLECGALSAPSMDSPANAENGEGATESRDLRRPCWGGGRPSVSQLAGFGESL